ncbi:hypothetical protein GBA52_028969 [Prunus armeniaca]|nr:hypothetical protein GBA52_028969 [Prunus armeniaca]
MVVDIGLLDLSTDIWKEQLNFLDKYSGKAKFAWMLNHDTSNAIKMELRRKGCVLMVNKPLYKAKMVHILEVVIKDRNLETERRTANGLRSTTKEGELHECLEIDSTQFDVASSDDSDICEKNNTNSKNALHIEENQRDRNTKPSSSQYQTVNSCLVELTNIRSNLCDLEDTEHKSQCGNSRFEEQHLIANGRKEHGNSHRAVNQQKSLEGLTHTARRRHTSAAESCNYNARKMGATVIAVADGLQAVDALNCMLTAEDCGRELRLKDRDTNAENKSWVPVRLTWF